MFNNKKGVVFTVISLLLVGVLITTISYNDNRYSDTKKLVVESRVITMDEFIGSVEEDVTRAMFISGYRSFISLQNHVSLNGSFLTNLTNSFSEIFINGTINNNSQSLMANASMNDWGFRIGQEANLLNIDTNFDIINIDIFHSTPWIVTINLTMVLNFTDTSDFAAWHYNHSFFENITIFDFEDPLYSIKSNGKVNNLIIKTSETEFVNEATNDTSNLNFHLNESFYFESIDAPNFLMRFQGNFSPSQFGIESFVNLEDLSIQGITTYNKSVIDYQYFNDTYDDSDDKCNFQDMPSWFRIHEDKRDFYNISDWGVNC